MRQMTTRGYDFLEKEEGERLFAYDDATGRRVGPGDPVLGTLTIGVGHTGPDVFKGQTITHAQSRDLFDKDTDWAEACVEATCEGANDNEFDAMVSLCFNIGAAAFRSSSVARWWNTGDKVKAGNAFSLWCKTTVDGKLQDSPGLIARRARETGLFFSPMPSEVPKLMPQKVEVGAPTSKIIIGTTIGAGTTAGSIADQIDQIQPTIDAIATAGASLQSILKLGGLALSIVAFCALVYVGVRYFQKRRRGEVVST